MVVFMGVAVVTSVVVMADIDNLVAQAEYDTIKKVISFLNERAEQFYKLGGVHLRESVALGEAAIILEQEYLTKRP